MSNTEIRTLSIKGKTSFSLLDRIVLAIRNLSGQDSSEEVIHESFTQAHGALEFYVWRVNGRTITLKGFCSTYLEYTEGISLTFSPGIQEGSAFYKQISNLTDWDKTIV